MYKNNRSYEHKKNRNCAVARFRFFIANTTKGNCCVLSQPLFFVTLILKRTALALTP